LDKIAANGQKIAVFDVDETLITDTSAEVELIKFLIDKKVISLARLLKCIAKPLGKLPRGWETAILWKSYYLKDLSIETIGDLLPEFFAERIFPRIFKPLAETIPLFKDKGFKVYLLSGTLSILIPPLIEYFAVDDGVGSQMEVIDGKFTGLILGTHPYYKGKVPVLKELLGNAVIDYENSFAFGDSFADRPLLSLFGHPFAVHPGRLLSRHARKSGWEIVDNSFSAQSIF